MSPPPRTARPACGARRLPPMARPRRAGWAAAGLGVAALALLFGPAAALAASGVTVRLSTDEPMSDPVVELDDAGHPTTMQLKDDGQQPDVIEGDGTWAATAISSGGEMGITLRSGDKSWTTRSEAFPMGNGPRDLDLTLSAGLLVATPRLAGSVAPTPADGGPPRGAGPGGAPNGGDPGQPGVAPGGAQRSQSAVQDDNGPLLIGLGVGLLAMAALGWRAFGRGETAAAPAVPGARRQAQAPALGAIGPSLSEGLSLVLVEAADADAAPDGADAAPEGASEGGAAALGSVLPLLLRSLAEHYRVLVVIPDEVSLPALPGALWRAALDSPGQVGDAAEALEAKPGPPVAVVVVGRPAAERAALTEQLPETIGGLLVCPAAGAPDPEALRLRLGPEGLHVAWREQQALLPIDDSGGLQLALR